MKRVLLAVLVIVMLLTSRLTSTTAQTNPPMEGLWLTEGYGMLIEISPDTIQVYEITAVSCSPTLTLPNTAEAFAAADLILTLQNEQLVIGNSMTRHIVADRLETPLAVCENGGTPESNDPQLNFEIFWNTFNEQYAFFDLYGVDWQAQYDIYRPQVTADTTSDELFAILSAMIEPLDDGHVSLHSDTDDFSPAPVPEWWASHENELGRSIRSHYIYGDGLTQLADGLINYRWQTDTVGYVSILQMAGFGEDNASERANVEAAIDQVVAEFADAEAVIIDVRFNGGGYDAIALTLAGRFADQERLAFTKQTRNGDGFTPPDRYYVTPGGPQQYTGQVIVLTSPLTASAAEIFLLAMQDFPYVTIIGEPASGGYSDILGRTLPNGWTFGLSNQVYYASDGQVYEGIGFQPDIIVPINVENLLAGEDDILNAALAQSGGEQRVQACPLLRSWFYGVF